MKKVSKKEKIISLLRANKNGVTNIELSKIALRYGGYLGQLYKDGYDIKTVAIGDGVYLYILKSEPEKIENHISAYQKLMYEVRKKGSITASELEQVFKKIGVSVKYKANTYKKS